MTVVEFLIQLLTTHAQVLQRLAAYFGEEPLLELMEKASELQEEKPAAARNKDSFHLDTLWFTPAPLKLAKTSPYAELEGTVRELNLPAVLEFHLWAYPYYRTLIESSLDLKMTIHPQKPGGEVLVREAIAQAKTWLKQLPIHPAHAHQVETLGLAPWIRFQNEMMKRLGGRPLNTV